MTVQNHTIDAAGKKLGRVASEAARFLMDKHSPAFERHRKAGTVVEIVNAGKLAISEKRGLAVRYASASGYAGDLKKETIAALKARRGIAEVVRRAVKGMLPANKLRPQLLKHLAIHE
jgi:large subunit ribosomal protein L13